MKYKLKITQTKYQVGFYGSVKSKSNPYCFYLKLASNDNFPSFTSHGCIRSWKILRYHMRIEVLNHKIAKENR